jgi:ATP-binding cassette, subfamily B, bacterial CvaB/MchF/RaxB
MFELRSKFDVTIRGINLQQLINIAAEIELTARPLRLEIDELNKLETPCILHWDFNHYVVLAKATATHIEIIDPAIGRRRLSLSQVSNSFTGVALELLPTVRFKSQKPAPQVKLRQLTGDVSKLLRPLLAIGLVAFALELFAVLSPLYTQLVIDNAILARDYSLLNILAAGFILLLLGQIGLSAIRSWLIIILGQRLSLQWRARVFRHLISLPITWFEKRHLGDIAARFGSIGPIQQAITGSIVESILDGVMAIGALIMMMIYAPSLACVVLAFSIANALTKLGFQRALAVASSERIALAARENSHFLETVRSILPIRIAGRGSERTTRWLNLWVELQKRDYRSGVINVSSGSVMALLAGVENVLVVWLAARIVIDGGADPSQGFTIGMMFAFMSYKSQFTGRISALIEAISQYQLLGLHTSRLADIVLTPTEPGSQLERVSKRHLDLQSSIEFKNVSFRYSASEPWILRNISFKIEVGQLAVIQGPSGCGKTTLLKLILGVAQPTVGEILFGGESIAGIGIDRYRQRLGCVLQDDMLLTGSILENISFFAVEPDIELATRCAIAAQIHSEIEAIPTGYHTLIGEQGSGLSGGQRQRILLARALYREPSILILDEATSSLDLDNVKKIDSVISEMNLTRVVVTHRKNAAADADVYLRLSKGSLVQAP